MKLRYIAYTAAAIGLMSMGWYAHQVVLYAQDIHAKAALCEKLDCYALDETAQAMLANGLPVTR